jgi:site-specific DNA-methyltransferase (adenine-specific)
MAELGDRSVDLVVTSPPYWQLKDYGAEQAIGFNNSYEEYINHLNLVWREVYRVLDHGCRLCIDIGDQYARSVYYGRYKVIPIRTEIIRFCETIGFDYMGAIIWQKIATTNTSGGAAIMGSYPFPRNGILKLDYEFILVFKKDGKSAKKISPEIKEQSRMSKEEWNTFFTGHWNFPGVKQNKHLAMFPGELPRRLIKMFTFVGDTVLDPFLGSGTTSLAALRLNRGSAGYEINREFLPLIREKLADGEYIEQQTHIDLDGEIKKLPYIFHDPVKLSKKIDPKKKQFGSKIDKNHRQPETYYRVTEIISPGQMVLDDHLNIKLTGIVEDKRKTGAALEFLAQKLKGQQVFLKREDGGAGPGDGREDPLPCYLYLRNKTFINAHLIKAGLAHVDENADFKYKKRFLKYRGYAVENN